MNTYATIQGDTWDVIAKRVYGNEYRADFLMQNNFELLDILVFPSGIKINTPDLPSANTYDTPPWR